MLKILSYASWLLISVGLLMLSFLQSKFLLFPSDAADCRVIYWYKSWMMLFRSIIGCQCSQLKLFPTTHKHRIKNQTFNKSESKDRIRRLDRLIIYFFVAFSANVCPNLDLRFIIKTILKEMKKFWRPTSIKNFFQAFFWLILWYPNSFKVILFLHHQLFSLTYLSFLWNCSFVKKFLYLYENLSCLWFLRSNIHLLVLLILSYL